METETKNKQQVINDLKIISIQAQFFCGRNLNIDEIQKKLIGVKYDSKRYWAMSLSIKKPKATMRIFNSGKVSCFGTKSIEDAKMACKKCAYILQKIGYDEIQTLDDFEIINVVCGDSPLGFGVDLNKMCHIYVGNSTYDPSRFPALNFTVLRDPSACAKIFSNGKIGITGAKSLEDAKKVYGIVYDIAKKFKMPIPVKTSSSKTKTKAKVKAKTKKTKKTKTKATKKPRVFKIRLPKKTHKQSTSSNASFSTEEKQDLPKKQDLPMPLHKKIGKISLPKKTKSTSSNDASTQKRTKST